MFLLLVRVRALTIRLMRTCLMPLASPRSASDLRTNRRPRAPQYNLEIMSRGTLHVHQCRQYRTYPPLGVSRTLSNYGVSCPSLSSALAPRILRMLTNEILSNGRTGLDDAATVLGVPTPHAIELVYKAPYDTVRLRTKADHHSSGTRP